MNVLSSQKKSMILYQLVEGASIRSVERITEVHRDTIMQLMVSVGETAKEILDNQMVNLKSNYIQVDEIWTYVGKKQKQLTPLDSPEFGDQYVFVAMDSDKKNSSYILGR